MAAISPQSNGEIILKHKIERVSRIFTPQEIATVAGVQEQDVSRFNEGKSLKRSIMRKLVAAYDSLDVRGFLISSPYK